jgi:carbon monoxide dehydrogenase subunit G
VKVSGSSVLHAEPARVWAAVTDPAVLATVIPGCEALTPIAENRFGLTVTLGVASIKGSYTGEVSLFDLREPESLTMRANGSGGPGTIDTTVAVNLTALADGSTRLDYDADAMVGGMVGGVGQRVLAGVAKKTAGLFFAAIDDVLTGARPLVSAGPTEGEAAAGEPAALAPPTGVAVPARGPAPAQRPSAWSFIGAAAFGAISMLVGVLVGARIARRQGSDGHFLD